MSKVMPINKYFTGSGMLSNENKSLNEFYSTFTNGQTSILSSCNNYILQTDLRKIQVHALRKPERLLLCQIESKNQIIISLFSCNVFGFDSSSNGVAKYFYGDIGNRHYVLFAFIKEINCLPTCIKYWVAHNRASSYMYYNAQLLNGKLDLEMNYWEYANAS